MSDADCANYGTTALVCALEMPPAVCRPASEFPIRVGMSAPATGPSQDLGVEMRKGVLVAFDEANATGGIRGRQLQLDFRDDLYIPDNAEANTRSLLDVHPDPSPARCTTSTTPPVVGQTPIGPNSLSRGPSAVIALLGNVGTPTMVRSAPIAVETGTLFFGALTGSKKVLRDGSANADCSRYIFNVRASYGQEARATLEYFFKQGVPDGKHILSFDQSDSFGQAGYDGITTAYTALKGAVDMTPPEMQIQRFRYTRDDVTSVPAQTASASKYLASVLAQDTANHTIGIMCTGTYGPVSGFIQGIRNWQYTPNSDQAKRLTIEFSAVSFVGANTLASRLQAAGTVMGPNGALPYTDNVVVSQVVPNYFSDKSQIVARYKNALATYGAGDSVVNSAEPSFNSLEGYIAATVFISGLQLHQKAFTPKELISTFEGLSKDLGLGAASFTPTNHQYLRSVWGTSLSADGKFNNRYYWVDGSTIQLFE